MKVIKIAEARSIQWIYAGHTVLRVADWEQRLGVEFETDEYFDPGPIQACIFQEGQFETCLFADAVYRGLAIFLFRCGSGVFKDDLERAMKMLGMTESDLSHIGDGRGLWGEPPNTQPPHVQEGTRPI